MNTLLCIQMLCVLHCHIGKWIISGKIALAVATCGGACTHLKTWKAHHLHCSAYFNETDQDRWQPFLSTSQFSPMQFCRICYLYSSITISSHVHRPSRMLQLSFHCLISTWCHCYRRSLAYKWSPLLSLKSWAWSSQRWKKVFHDNCWIGKEGSMKIVLWGNIESRRSTTLAIEKAPPFSQDDLLKNFSNVKNNKAGTGSSASNALIC